MPNGRVDRLRGGMGYSVGGALGEFQVSGPRDNCLDDAVEPSGPGQSKGASYPDGAQVVECAVNG